MWIWVHMCKLLCIMCRPVASSWSGQVWPNHILRWAHPWAPVLVYKAVTSGPVCPQVLFPRQQKGHINQWTVSSQVLIWVEETISCCVLENFLIARHKINNHLLCLLSPHYEQDIWRSGRTTPFLLATGLMCSLSPRPCHFQPVLIA